MNPDGNHFRVLLIQVREREDVERQERACFIERCGIRPDQLDPVNILHAPVPSMDRVDAANAVLIGGAGTLSVTQAQPFDDALTDLVRTLCDRGRPLFGACWGHQFIARALGGTVVTDHDRKEVGTHRVELTPAGRSDPLFDSMPPRFSAHMGHHDYVSELPSGAIELAVSETCPAQAFRIEGTPVYGTQFHCELNTHRLLERLRIYRHIYQPADDDLEELEREPVPTPEADIILRRFIETCVRSR